jgi:hypothetical protein
LPNLARPDNFGSVQTVIELRAKAAELRKVADTLEAAAKALIDLGKFDTPQLNLLADEPTRSAKARDFSRMSGLDAIYAILEDVSPTSLRKEQIADMLRFGGKAIGGNTLQSYLSRDSRFKSEGHGFWGLAVPHHSKGHMIPGESSG